MTKRFSGILVATAVLALAACGGGDGGDGGSAPSGQVVAKVAGEEITQREVAMELKGISTNNPEAAKEAQRAAVAAIVNRKLFAAAAREAGVDKAADYQLQLRRATEIMLAETYQRQIASKLPRPTREEAEQFIQKHPHMYAQRKIFEVDQIQFPRSLKPEEFKSLVALDSLDAVEQRLLSAGIEYRRSPNAIDVRSVPPQMVDQLLRLKPGELFMVPTSNAIVANQIKQTRVVPFTGEQAITHAQQLIMKDKIDRALKQRMDELRKAAGEVQYSAGFEPRTGKAAQPPRKAPAKQPESDL